MNSEETALEEYIKARTYELSLLYGEYIAQRDFYRAAEMIEVMNEINKIPLAVECILRERKDRYDDTHLTPYLP